ncbi:CopM family metallochaperone [Paraburkholderia sediminicola]|uniref:CopM family metallochaperone n=1 Tax=Paraburkholderia sediminicola TaxID=458836 RepID=UPI0038B8CCC7
MKYPFARSAATVLTGIVLAIGTLPAGAQQGASMPGMKMSSSADSGAGPSTPAFKEADEKMMKDMSAPSYTGDADKDFVAHMIPHHQEAVAMAEVELKYGKDPELKRLAKNILKAQHEEIAFMQRWQAKHGGK